MIDLEESFPSVSIVIPVYNTGKYVIHTLDSILNQAYPIDKIQVIVIDDASTDNSVEVINSWLLDNASLKATLFLNAINLGLNATLNKGIKEYVNHEFLIIIGDDVLLKDRIRLQVKALQENPAAAFCFSDMEVIDAEGNLIKTSYMHDGYKVDVEKFTIENLYERVLVSNFVPAPTIMHRKSILKEMGCFDEELSFEDLDMSLKILKKYKATFIPESLVQYRLLKGSLSNNALDKLKIVKSYFLIYEKHLGNGYDKLLIKRLDWYLERLYLLKQPDLKSFTMSYMTNWCENKTMVNFIKWGMPYFFYRIIRKLKLVVKKR